MRRFLVLVLLLCAAAPAGAQPWRRPEPPPRYYEPRPDSRWTQLLVRPTSQPGVDVVIFRGKGGRLSVLRVAPVAGVREIVVEYDRRPPQRFRVERWQRRGPELMLEVDRGARIRQIVIYSRPNRRAPFAIWGA